MVRGRIPLHFESVENRPCQCLSSCCFVSLGREQPGHLSTTNQPRRHLGKNRWSAAGSEVDHRGQFLSVLLGKSQERQLHHRSKWLGETPDREPAFRRKHRKAWRRIRYRKAVGIII